MLKFRVPVAVDKMMTECKTTLREHYFSENRISVVVVKENDCKGTKVLKKGLVENRLKYFKNFKIINGILIDLRNTNGDGMW